MDEAKNKDIEIEALKRKLESLQKDYDELKKSTPSNDHKIMQHPQEFWVDIYQKFNKDNDSIKALVQTKKMTVYDRDLYGRTLLVVAARFGCYDIVRFCVNAGADLDAKNDDNKTAMDYAKDLGYHHIEQLLVFSKLNLNIGNEIKNTANIIHQQNGINNNLSHELGVIGAQTKQLYEATLMEVMINIINKRLSFSDHLLNYCWNMVCSQNKTEDPDPLTSELWKAISKTCSDIIEHGSKRDWYWLKTCIIPSTIWFKELEQTADVEQKEEKTANKYLYYELLKLVDAEAMNQLIKLEQDLNALASQSKTDWSTLIKWDAETTEEPMAEAKATRQDIIPNGVASRYTYSQLSITSGYTFNSPMFYDYKEYLSRLVLVAQLNDEKFQNSVQDIYKIDKVTNEGCVESDDDSKSNADGKVIYQRGPLKSIERARQKAMGDYVNEAYPASACVLDFNRCALIFNDISTMLRALQLFVNKVKYYKSDHIIGIVRCKNGFVEYVKKAQYSDVKLNVVIKGVHNNIIGEVQFLLNRMKSFKDIAHRLYVIQRQEEAMETSVSHFLPFLLNEDKLLFTAGCRGDVKALCNLMVIHNKSFRDIMKTEKKTGNTILHRICSLCGLKALLFVKSILDRKQFIDEIFLSNAYDIKPIEYVLRHSHISLVKHLFVMKQVKERFVSNDDMIWRLCFFLFVRNTNKYITDYVLSVLQIKQKKVQEMMGYRYKSAAVFTHWQRYEMKKYSIMGQIVAWADSGALDRLLYVIGESSFCETVFVRDGSDFNVMERAIKINKMKAIKRMLSFKQVTVRYRADNDLLFRLMSSINKYFKLETAQYIVNELGLTGTKLNELKSYRNIDISPELQLVSNNE